MKNYNDNKKYNRLEKITIAIIIILLLLFGYYTIRDISTSIRIAVLQHNARPKQENPTIKKIKTILYMPIYGLKIVLFGSGIYADIDEYQAPAPAPAPAPQKHKQYVKF
ncbi:hypothetical protein IKP85_07490 [bacterium]|nr:hypothetical protein [bacterium]